MAVKRYLFRYSLVTIGLPLGLYIAAIFGNDMLRKVIALSLVVIAVIVISFSKNIIQFMFGMREHEYIDGEFLSKISCALIILFFARYIVANIAYLIPNKKDLVMCIVASPAWLLIFIPMLKNYCINKQTVVATLVVSFLIVYVIFPTLIYFINKSFSSDYLILDSVYYNYFGYTYLSNKSLFFISSLAKLRLSSSVLFALQVIMSFIFWCIMYLPYIVMSAVWVDERSYMEKGNFTSTRTLVVLVIILVTISTICMLLGIKGTINPDYVLRHGV